VPSSGPHEWDAVGRFARFGPAPLLAAAPGAAEEPRLHLAVIVPPFRRGSGGHTSIFQLLSRLERRGHTVSLWIEDHAKEMADQWPGVIRYNLREWFAPFGGPVFKDFGEWYGADVVVATGWQTVHRAMLLPCCRARAYLVHDHESEFYATSAEARWAEETYSLDLHAICSSPWLADIVRERYGGTTSLFDFGVDHAVYRPRAVPRRRDTVMFYARNVTPRRAVPLGMLALQELHERRPDVRIVCFGSQDPVAAPFPYEHLGIAAPEQLAWAYAEATVGVVLSMTNYSLVPQEMLACGLPCVDLAGFSAEGVFGADGPVELAPFHPVALADAIDHMLVDEVVWRRRSESGLAFVRERTWDHATDQVEAGLRDALRVRDGSPA
jgi:glycosyltransferase involved in cell wall biosynthesis